MPAQPVNPTEIAISVSKDLAVRLLGSIGAVPPFGIAFVGSEAAPKTFFPRDKHPKLDFSGLVDKVIDLLRGQVEGGDVVATATVSEVVSSGNSRGFATQVESPKGISLLVYPYRIEAGVVVVEEPKFERGLIMFSGTYPLPPQ